MYRLTLPTEMQEQPSLLVWREGRQDCLLPESSQDLLDQCMDQVIEGGGSLEGVWIVGWVIGRERGLCAYQVGFGVSCLFRVERTTAH